ncbi:MAG: putative DNA-binding domain-containing protein, partial [Psychrobium sp.]
MNEQQQLLSAIWDNSAIEHGFSEEGVAIYHRNLLANAKRGLAVSFPTLFELLDGGDSDELVAEFLRYSPPNQGDWGQWGGELAGFLESHRFSE